MQQIIPLATPTIETAPNFLSGNNLETFKPKPDLISGNMCRTCLPLRNTKTCVSQPTLLLSQCTDTLHFIYLFVSYCTVLFIEFIH